MRPWRSAGKCTDAHVCESVPCQDVTTQIVEREARVEDAIDWGRRCTAIQDGVDNCVLRVQACGVGEKPAIQYRKQEIGGVLVRPDTQAVVRKAVEGHTIEVLTANDYINLYHVFERMQSRHRQLRGLRLARSQVGESKWLVTVVPVDAPSPTSEIEHGYDPKRGRYKRYAQRLAAGECVKVRTRVEAVKARRAWQLYVKKETRAHLRSMVRCVRNRFEVQIVDRASRRPFVHSSMTATVQQVA